MSSEGYYYGEAEGEIRCFQPHSDLSPNQISEGVGPTHTFGPTAQPSIQIVDKYSRVYVRQKYPPNKPSNLQSVEKQSQVQKADKDRETIIHNCIKTHNPSQLESNNKLKSKITGNTEVMEEAHQLWEVGQSLGMEAETDHSVFIQHYADMESNDQKEAMELGNRTTHR